MTAHKTLLIIPKDIFYGFKNLSLSNPNNRKWDYGEKTNISYLT